MANMTKSGRSFQKANEFEHGGLVVSTVRRNFVQHWSDECTGLRQACASARSAYTRSVLSGVACL